jgi:uncharacterized membrane protein
MNPQSEQTMAKVAKSVVIKRDAAQVMEYICDVNNHPAFIGPLKSVDNLRGDPRQSGTSWNWTFVMAGVEFSGKAESVAYLPGKQFIYRTTAGIESTFTYSAEPAKGGTKITIDVSYQVPQTLLAKMKTSVVEKLNDAEGARAVENLKAILDA